MSFSLLPSTRPELPPAPDRSYEKRLADPKRRPFGAAVQPEPLAHASNRPPAILPIASQLAGQEIHFAHRSIHLHSAAALGQTDSQPSPGPPPQSAGFRKETELLLHGRFALGTRLGQAPRILFHRHGQNSRPAGGMVLLEAGRHPRSRLPEDAGAEKALKRIRSCCHYTDRGE